jgi:glutamate dehydrogenase/leucine dehydrogenase
MVTRNYIRAIADFIGPFKDIPAPDVYTDESIMVWILDEFEQLKREHVPASVTGKPYELGGIRARNYSTSLGGIFLLEEALKEKDMEKSGIRVAIQGFGNVGENAARILHERGYKVIAVSDSKGGIISKKGLDIHEVIGHKKSTGALADFAKADTISNDELLTCDCDVLIPAALSYQLDSNNAEYIKAKLFERSVMLIPDVLANNGGVVGSYFEWIQNLSNDYWKHEIVLERLKNAMITSFNDIYAACRQEKCTMRKTAYKTAVKRILKAEKLRGNL